MGIPFARSLAGLFSAKERMRKDWDLRARRNARYYIDCGHGGSEAEFWRSGEEDLRNYVLRDVELDSSAAALEIGCGMGRLLKPLSERVAVAAGVDISGEMIRLAGEALAGRANVRIARTDGDLAGFSDASLDLVYSHIVFQHIPTKAAVSRYFAESARVLKAGGVFRFQVDGRSDAPRRRIPNTWNGVRFGAGEIRAELSSLGFEVCELTGEGTQYMWITALRRGEPGRAATAAVRVRARAWDSGALDRLLERLGLDPEGLREGVVSGEVGLRNLVEPLLGKHRAASPRAYVAALYRALLGREPDEGGLRFYAGEIERGADRGNVVDCLLASPEFDAKHRTGASNPNAIPHRA